jgi:hypothetical protein
MAMTVNPVVRALQFIHMEIATDSAISQRKQWLAAAKFEAGKSRSEHEKCCFGR